MTSGMMDGRPYCGCGAAGRSSWSGVFDLRPWTAAGIESIGLRPRRWPGMRNERAEVGGLSTAHRALVHMVVFVVLAGYLNNLLVYNS